MQRWVQNKTEIDIFKAFYLNKDVTLVGMWIGSINKIQTGDGELGVGWGTKGVGKNYQEPQQEEGSKRARRMEDGYQRKAKIWRPSGGCWISSRLKGSMLEVTEKRKELWNPKPPISEKVVRAGSWVRFPKADTSLGLWDYLFLCLGNQEES